jgi:hypothetical protein
MYQRSCRCRVLDFAICVDGSNASENIYQHTRPYTLNPSPSGYLVRSINTESPNPELNRFSSNRLTKSTAECHYPFWEASRSTPPETTCTRNDMPQKQSGDSRGWNLEPEIASETGLLTPDSQHEPRPKKLMCTVCAICAAALISGCVVWIFTS